MYESVLLRRTYRDGGKVKHETLANLKALPKEAVAAIEATLKGQQLVPAERAVTITRSLPHGHVAAVAAMADKLGLPALLGPACRERDLVFALIISRVVRPSSTASTPTWWSDTTLGADLGVADTSTDEIDAAMDWLEGRQYAIERQVTASRLICILANFLVGHLRQAWAPHPCRTVDGLLDHLATLTRNHVLFPGANTTVPMLTEATPDQRHAFDLIGTSIPLTLT